MYDLSWLKYQDPVLRSKLLATDDAYLEETNGWFDRFWGVCLGTGHNHLGKILMKVRQRIRDEAPL
jgi:predicted NAD-dependent protein-ADP-ribosyltransferase YbiA (DUF1768 family)